MCVISDEGVYVDTNGKVTKNVVLQWGELPTSVGELLFVSQRRRLSRKSEFFVFKAPKIHF